MTDHVPHGASIRLINVSRRWGRAVALDRVTVEIEPGSFTVLLGPSGCGKSTCLRLIAGLDEPSEGRIEIDGRDVTSLPPAARGIAMVFQSYALFPHLDVRENILFGLKARNVPRMERDKRLRVAAEMLGIGHLLGRRPAELSGGQQQRVALGRAIVAQAPICLMDEPLSNLDAQLRAEMRREILALQRRLGITMVYVTHDQAEAMTMADQVVLLRHGKIEQDAHPADLYSEPATMFVAGFIGAPPMNLVPLKRLECGFVIAGTEAPIISSCLNDTPAMIAGIRPEAITLAEDGIAGRVGHTEYLGADTIIGCDVGSPPVRLHARLPGRVCLVRGQEIRLQLKSVPHFFDPRTGRRTAFLDATLPVESTVY